jgi:hypothetical protein
MIPPEIFESGRKIDLDPLPLTVTGSVFAKLLLDEEGFMLQEILVKEVAKLGDTATRSLLQQILVESTLAKIIGCSLQAPRDALDCSEQLTSILTETIKRAMVFLLTNILRLVDDLLFLMLEGKRILSTARKLQEFWGGRLNNNHLCWDKIPWYKSIQQ